MDTRALLTRLWRSYIKSYWAYILLAIFFMLLYALTTAALAKLMEPVIDDVFKNEDVGMLKWVSIWVMATFLIKGIGSFGERVTMNYIGQSVIAGLHQDVFNHIMQADLATFQQHPSGSLVSKCTYQITMIKNMVATSLTSIGKDSFTILGLTGVMFYQNLTLSLIAFVILPLAILPLSRIGKKMRKVSTKTQDRTGDITAFMTQAFQGIRIIKAYNQAPYIQEKNKTLVQTLRQLALKSGKIRAITSPVMETLGGGAIVIVISYGGMQVIQGHSTAGAFFSFITALLLLYEPLKRLANLHTNLQEGLAATQDIFKTLDHEAKVVSPKNAPMLPADKTEIRFDHVGFSYEATPVIHDISFTIPQGKAVAIVGPSGAGKSTLFNLLLRFYDPTQGKIQIGGQDIKACNIESLRELIGYVGQETTLFNTTIRENITFGDTTISEDRILQAAKAAHAHAFIEALPQGYDTPIGEQGLKLSGGQRQRIAIARAFLKDAPLLLLDEATSALDTKSEKAVQEALDKLIQNRTCLMIAHRLSTVQNADHIYVMKEGAIVEEGTHSALVTQGGTYAQLVALQELT